MTRYPRNLSKKMRGKKTAENRKQHAAIVRTPRISCSINDNHRRQNSSPGVYLLSYGLLQLHAVWHVRRPSVEDSVHSESRRTSGHSNSTMRLSRRCCVRRRCCVSCIDCLSVNESSTWLHAWYTSRWLVRHMHT